MTMIRGIKEVTERHVELKNVWDICKNAGVNPPEEVLDFFDGEYPDYDNVEVDLSDHKNVKRVLKGYEILLDGLPNGLQKIHVEIPRGTPVEMARWDLEELLPEKGFVLLASLFGGDGTGYSRSTFYKEARKLLETQKGEVRDFPENGGLHVRRLPPVEKFVAEEKTSLAIFLNHLIVGYLPKDFRYYTDDAVFPALLKFIEGIEHTHTSEKSVDPYIAASSDWELLNNGNQLELLGAQFAKLGLTLWATYVERECKKTGAFSGEVVVQVQL